MLYGMINKYSHIHGAGIKQNHVFPVKSIKLMYSIYLKMTVKTFMSSFELCVYSNNKYWKKNIKQHKCQFFVSAEPPKQCSEECK